ncbi:MAG: YfhO family protein [Acidobacteriota bacterium]
MKKIFQTWIESITAIDGASLKTHLSVFAILLLLIIALFWRVFFLGETLVDLAAHENQLPWGAARSTYNGYNYNRRDLTDTYVTRDYFVVNSYRAGELPLWNPYILGGHPIYADGVTKLLSPAQIFYLWFDVPLGYTLGRLTELLLLAFFLYIFLINLDIAPAPACLGSIAFLLSDHVMHHLSWLGWIGGVMWLPLMLLGADRALNRNSFWAAAGAGSALALQFYAGFMPAAIYYLAALSAYYLAVAWLVRDEKARRMWRACRCLGISLLVGFGLSAPIWLPAFELLGYSNRKIVPTELGYIWLPPWHLLTLLLPRAFGSAFDARSLQMFVEMGVSQDRSVYLGLLALPLIGLALWRPRDRRVYYFAGLVVSALLVLTCAPLYVHITKYLPILRTIRAITRINVLYAFGGAVLVAYGSNRLLTLTQPLLTKFLMQLRRISIYWLGVLVGATLLLGGFGRYLPQDIERGNWLRRWGLKIANSLAEQFHWGWHNYDLFVPFTMVLIVILLCWYFLYRPPSATMLLAIIALLLTVELIWNDSQYNRTFPAQLVYRQTATTDLLSAKLGNYRLVVAPAEFRGKAGANSEEKIVAPPNTLLPYRLATIYGKDQLFPKWYRDLTALIEPQPELSHIIFNRQQSPFYDLLGVKYLLTRAENITSDEHYREIYQGEGIRLYENLAVMPRAFFASQVRLAKRPEDVLAIMKEPSFDPHVEVVVESAAPNVQNVTAADRNDSVEITRYWNNEVRLQASNSGTRLLVLTDTYYPNWEVFVDGKAMPLLRVNHALRGVVLEAGEHQVQFVFRPRSLLYGLELSLVTLAFLAIGAMRNKVELLFTRN